jgi:hypothetical protein
MDPDIDLQGLMARYQQGDSDAATALVHRLSPQLHRFFLVKVVTPTICYRKPGCAYTRCGTLTATANPSFHGYTRSRETYG